MKCNLPQYLGVLILVVFIFGCGQSEETKNKTTEKDPCENTRYSLEWNKKEVIEGVEVDSTEGIINDIVIIPAKHSECFVPISWSSVEYNISYIEKYLQSSNKAKLNDGQYLCLKSLKLNENVTAKMFYIRSEGGHLSDEVGMYVYDNSSIYKLILTSEYGKEGYHKLITSQWSKPTIITRTITETFGDRYENGQCPQPVRITTQKIKITESNTLKMVSENVETQNFDQYIK